MSVSSWNLLLIDSSTNSRAIFPNLVLRVFEQCVAAGVQFRLFRLLALSNVQSAQRSRRADRVRQRGEHQKVHGHLFDFQRKHGGLQNAAIRRQLGQTFDGLAAIVHSKRLS